MQKEEVLSKKAEFFWKMPGEKRLAYLTDGEPMRVDEVSPTLTYLGYAPVASSPADAVWKIKRVQVIGTETIFSYADGDKNFNNIWNDRATITYL